MDSPMPSSLVEILGTLEDPRVDRTQLHPLTDILVLSVLAVICGADSFVAIALFGRIHEEWLRTFLELPNGIPSHDTLGRVFARLDASGFEEGFRDWVQAAFARTDGQVVAVDGKCLRGSHDRGRGLGPLHLVSAWAQANRLVLAQTAVDDKSNEITAIPELLRMLVLKGCIVTLDAMGCQKAIARPIRKQGADYVLRLRDNHPGIHARLRDIFALERAGNFAGYAHDYADTVGKDHGRIETRRCWTTGDPALLAHADPDRAWCDLASLVWVESERRCGDRVTTGVRIFIPACRPRPGSNCRRCAGTGHRERPPLGHGYRLRRGRQPHSHGPCRPQHGHPETHRSQPPAAGPIAQGGHRQQAPGGGLGQELSVPIDGPRTQPQAQTNLDAIAQPCRAKAA